MNDNYVEKLVKKKADAKTMLIRTGVIVLGLLIVYLSVVFLGYLSVAYYGLISVFLLVWLIYYVFYMTSVEYEYALVKNELSIDIIYGKNKRKNHKKRDLSKLSSNNT